MKLIFKRLELALTLFLLNACQTLPFLQGGEDPRTAIKHEFSLTTDQSVIGQPAEVKLESGDSLPVVARYFGLGFDEITLANPDVDPWLPEEDSTVNLPLRFILPDAPRKGVVLNLAAKRLFYYSGNKVATYPVGIGRKGWKTPSGKTSIVAKKANPRWTVPRSIRLEHAKKGDPLPKVVLPGPNNPLGQYALRLGIPGYLIHGTNKPYGVGMAISHGCIRLYPENIDLLFKGVKKGTPVRIIHQPFLSGWKNEALYIQVYPPSHAGKQHSKRLLSAFKKKLQRIERQSKLNFDWQYIDAVIARHDGIPVAIIANGIEKQPQLRFSHPPELARQITPPPLDDESWRLKVAEFPESNSAQRLAVMLNHQGPPIPAHALPARSGFMVVAGPFHSNKEAKASSKRLQIDFALKPKLVQPGKNIPGTRETLFPFFQTNSFWN